MRGAVAGSRTRVLFVLVLAGALSCAAGTNPVIDASTTSAKCCAGKDSIEDLWDCVYKGSRARAIEVFEDDKVVQAVVVTFVTKELRHYAPYAMANLFMWAEYQGYPLVIYTEVDGEYDPDHRWSKVKIVSHALTKWAGRAEHVLWVDADVIVLDLNSTYNVFTDKRPWATLWICAENGGSSTNVNSGTFLVKNNQTGIELLEDWWSSGNRTLISDQQGLDQTVEKYMSHIAILQPSVFNTDPPAMSNLGESDRVLHLMGETDRLRACAFGHALNELCTSVADKRPAAKHLALDKSKLLDMTIDVHQNEVAEITDKIKSTAGADLTEGILFSLRKSSHPLSHAYKAIDDHKKADRLVKQVYETYASAIERMRGAGVFAGPETIHFKAQQGISLMGVATGPLTNITAVYDTVKADLDELQGMTHHEQQTIVLVLRSRLEENLAMKYIEHEMWDDAIEKIRKSVDLLKHDGISTRNMYQPMGTLGSLLCQTEQFDEGLKVIDGVITLQTKRLGRDHIELAMMWLNSGICKLQAKKFQQSMDAFKECMRIYRLNGHKNTAPEVQRAVFGWKEAEEQLELERYYEDYGYDDDLDDDDDEDEGEDDVYGSDVNAEDLSWYDDDEDEADYGDYEEDDYEEEDHEEL